MMVYVAGRLPPSPLVLPLATVPAAVEVWPRLAMVARPDRARPPERAVEPFSVAHGGVSLAAVQAACRETLGLMPHALSTHVRVRAVARPRQIAMAMARRWCRLSLPQIGRAFGNRDHTTVMHALQATKARIDAGNPVTIQQFEACDAAIRAIVPGVEPLPVWWKGPCDAA